MAKSITFLFPPKSIPVLTASDRVVVVPNTKSEKTGTMMGLILKDGSVLLSRIDRPFVSFCIVRPRKMNLRVLFRSHLKRCGTFSGIVHLMSMSQSDVDQVIYVGAQGVSRGRRGREDLVSA